MASYQDPNTGKNYLNFSRSPDGQLQHELVWPALLPYLPKETSARILDAGCGNGWLLNKLSAQYPNLYGIDISEVLLEAGRASCPQAQLQVWDLQQPLPFSNNFFDAATAVMTLNNLSNPACGLQNLSAALKPQGRLLVVHPNPYYAFPVGVWKRGIWGRLLGQKPKLKLRPYTKFAEGQGCFWDAPDKNAKSLPARFYTLANFLNSAFAAGLNLTAYRELTLAADSPKFDSAYISRRFPFRLLLVFEKIGK